MGSGLILLVIVGAWLAVLVPMGLRSSDGSPSQRSLDLQRSADRLGDAVRVLARRRPNGERTAHASAGVPVTAGSTAPAGEPQRDTSRDELLGEQEATAAAAPAEPVVVSDRRTAPLLPSDRRAAPAASDRPAVRRPSRPSRPAPRRTSLAVRRRRVLSVLLVLAAALLTAGLVLDVMALLAGAGACTLLAVLFVVHCRRQAVLKAQPARRRTPAERRAAQPQQLPEPVRRTRPVRRPLEVPAAHVEVEQPAAPAAAAGSSWQPVPVPLPTYVAKNQAVPRRPRPADLPEPDAWAAALQSDDAALPDEVDGPEIDAILDRRRAVGGW